MTQRTVPSTVPVGPRADAHRSFGPRAGSDDPDPNTTTAPPALADRTATRLLHQRILLLDRELEQDNGAQLCAQLVLLAAEDPSRDITLLINSPGGLVPAMLAIGDLMDVIPCDVRTVALGMAYSAGQYLLTHGAPGKRFILPHGRVLMHQGSAGFGGSAADIELQAEDLRRGRDLLIDITAERTGQSREQVARDSERDRIWEAADAVEYGFCDHVVGSLDQILPFGERRVAGARAGIRTGSRTGGAS
ncbi:ATP-dependent Clp protease proteolytic subunit [Brachybacterium halotolerans subsp. kimchii]|uniref:ClpP family protease n=1 Tax=Brachybacterium halotolerans TaxID=2795215 RepID=UPI001E6215A2|nr:ATP-dependent Clp protease proteolytic subunit [Brachybacterium halotolerans]UEJ83008.1 ATP-dependent Clp protease proteolytic subunit [Brachybacterium halotolerans subsp. kimchii]